VTFGKSSETLGLPVSKKREDSPLDTVLQFLEMINSHNVEGLSILMTDGHVFTDSLGETVKGRTKTTEAWKRYFEWMPDYRIRVGESMVQGQTVVIFGTASGTYSVKGKLLPKNTWQVPACWRAVVRKGRVSDWRIYADNKPVYDIMARRQ